MSSYRIDPDIEAGVEEAQSGRDIQLHLVSNCQFGGISDGNNHGEIEENGENGREDDVVEVDVDRHRLSGMDILPS